MFPSTGTFTVVFSSSQPWYTTQGDGVNFPDSWGMYIYRSHSANGIVEVADSNASNVIFCLHLILLTLEHMSQLQLQMQIPGYQAPSLSAKAPKMQLLRINKKSPDKRMQSDQITRYILGLATDARQ